MRTQRLTITATTLLALVMCICAPVAMATSPLLSGYGGPGEGNQAILGATLLGGSSEGGSGGGGSAASVSTAGGDERAGGGGEAVGQAAGVAGSRATPRGGAHGRLGSAAGDILRGTAKSPAASRSQSSGLAAGLSAARTSTVGSQVLGLTAIDVLYVLLVGGVLMLAGVAMWRLTHASHGGSTAG